MDKRFSVLALSAAVLLGCALAPASAEAEESRDNLQPVLLAKDSRSELADRIADYLNLSKEQRLRSESLIYDFDSRMHRHGSDNDRLYDGILNHEQRERLRRNESITLTPEQIRAFELRSSDYDRISDTEFNSFRNRMRPFLNEEQLRRLNSMNYSDWRRGYSENYQRYGNGRYRDYFSGRRDYNRRDWDYDRNTDGVPRTYRGVVGRSRYDDEYGRYGRSRYDRDYRYDRDRYDEKYRHDRREWERERAKERREWEREKDKQRRDFYHDRSKELKERREAERDKNKELKDRRDFYREKSKELKDRREAERDRNKDLKNRPGFERDKNKAQKDRRDFYRDRNKELKDRREAERDKNKDLKNRPGFDRDKNKAQKDRRDFYRDRNKELKDRHDSDRDKNRSGKDRVKRGKNNKD